MIIDLHMHSYYSPDGRCSIPHLIEMFSEGDIAGLTDHETIGGWKEFQAEAKRRKIKPVLGIEWFSDKCHILAYFLKDIPDVFFEFMSDRRSVEERCMRNLYQIFKKKFSKLMSYDEVLRLRVHPENVLGLPALSDAVSNAAGIGRTQAEDMIRHEKRQIPVGKRPTPFYPKEIIEKIIEWNAVPVLAHPYRSFGGKKGRQKKEDVEKIIRELFEAGIKGIDVYSWNSNQEELNHLLGLCDELKLFPIIGSDYHYEKKGINPKDLQSIDETIIKRVDEWLNSSITKAC
jgi:3',5'-nucleoside bisphosphate phosphatase